VVQALGIHDSGSIRALLAAVFQKQVTQGLKIVEENYLSGIDLKNFAERFLEEMRLLYLLVAAQESKVEISAEDLDISSGHLSGLKVVAEPLGLLRVERAIQILSKAIQQMTWSHLPRLILEMAVVRIANLDQLEKVEAAILENRRGEESPLQQSESPSSLRSEAEANLPPPAPPMPHMPVMSPPPPARPAPQAGEQNWKNFVEHVMRKRPLLGALLSHANFKLEDKGGAKKIILAFPSGGFYERQAKDSKSDIADQVKGFFGDKIEFILSSDLENTNTSIEQSNQAYETELKQKSKEHPAVLSWKQATGAEVVDVKLEQ
jgi:DNA polymerase-3 subunit gamma/tau